VTRYRVRRTPDRLSQPTPRSTIHTTTPSHATVETWRAAHEAYWHSEQVRAELGNPSFTVDDTTPVVLERFKLIGRL
jgi:hypothetical protein